MNSTGFWQEIGEQLESLKQAKSAADVLRILKVDGHNSPAFFAGSGGDGSMCGALREAGWSVVWMEADYHYMMKAPDGSAIEYIEGDIFGDPKV